jgi:uncharacterized membrane protein
MTASPIWTLFWIVLTLAPIIAIILLLELRERVRLLELRAEALEGERLAASPGVPPTPAFGPALPPPGPPRVPPPPPPAPPMPTPQPTGRATLSRLEGLLGGTWLNRVGVLIFVLGVAFFLKYAYDNDWIGRWIGPSGRVAIGLLAGIGLLLGGDRLQRAAYRVPAQGLVAAGIAILYLSIYAAHGFYQLLGPAPAFAFMVLVTATGMALAIRHDARVIAMLASIGGFLTPLLLATGQDAALTLFTYVAILDAGMLASAYWRQWAELHVLSFAATQLLYWGWFDRWYQPDRLPAALIAASVFFLLFALVAPVLAAGRRLDGRLDDLRRRSALITLAAPFLYFLASREILWPERKTWLAVLCLVLAGFYLVIGQWAVQTFRGHGFLALLHVAIALGFLTLAFPIQFAPHAATIAWSVEGVALLWGGFRLGAPKLRWGAVRLTSLRTFGVACGRDTRETRENWHVSLLTRQNLMPSVKGPLSCF